MASAVSDAFGLFGDGGDSDDDGLIAAPTLPPKPPPASMLQRVTVALSAEERRTRRFEPATVAAAAASLRTHGLAILPGLFDAAVLKGLGDAAIQVPNPTQPPCRQDTLLLLHTLKPRVASTLGAFGTRFPARLTPPQDLREAEALAHARTAHGPSGSLHGGVDWRFQELASRQAGRFEVRHGPRLTAALANAANDAAAASAPLEANAAPALLEPAPPGTRGAAAADGAHASGSAGVNLQAHPGVLEVLRHACAAPGRALDASLQGDRVVARDVGAFVSRPGARDQP